MNGSAGYFTNQWAPVLGGGADRRTIHFPCMVLSPGDYIEFQVFQNTGGALDLIGDASDLAFGMYRIG